MGSKMKNFSVIIVCLLILSSCKTEFEKIRTSNDPERIYNAANKYYEDGDYMKAQTMYELVIPFYRGKEAAETLFYNYAYTHYNTGQYILANHYFKSFGKTFFNSPMKEECEFMAAYSNVQLSPNHKLDQTYSEKAIEELQQFANRYPQSDRVNECNNLIDEIRLKMETKAFEQGQLYYNLSEYLSAISAFDNMIKDFPDSKRVDEVRYLVLKSSYEWAKKSVYDKREERYNETLKRIKQFKNKHAKSKYIDEAQEIEKNTLEALKIISNV